jgi:hypothetical protein
LARHRSNIRLIKLEAIGADASHVLIHCHGDLRVRLVGRLRPALDLSAISHSGFVLSAQARDYQSRRARAANWSGSPSSGEALTST